MASAAIFSSVLSISITVILLRLPVTKPKALALRNLPASCREPLKPTRCQLVILGFFVSVIGNVAIPSSAYRGCEELKTPPEDTCVRASIWAIFLLFSSGSSF
jgi:hypothetical protein